jgi:hypothetical protein
MSAVLSLADPPASSDRIPGLPRCSSLPSHAAAVAQRCDGLVLLDGKRRRDRYAAQQRRRHGKHQVVDLQLRSGAPTSERRPDGAAALRHGKQLGPETQAIAELGGQQQRQSIVAPFEAIHLSGRRLIGAGELIDESEERELFRIGEEEAPQPLRRLAQLTISVHCVQPRSDRSAADLGGDRRVPSPLGGLVSRRELVELP